MKNILPISVLIPTLNRPETLEKTLDSYLSCDNIPAQIVVVDQSQDSLMAEKIKKLTERDNGGTKILYVFRDEPSSSGARNTALKYAENEIIVFSDDDVDVYNDTLLNVYNLFKDKRLAMIAGINNRETNQEGKIGYLLGTKSFKNRKIGHVTPSMLGRYPPKISGEVETQWAMGFFFVVRKSLVDKWDINWDERMTGYAFNEDLDFTYAYYKRAKQEGLRCVLNENVRVVHRYSQEYRAPSRRHAFSYVLNRAYLSYKHSMGLKSALAVDWVNFCILLQRIAKKQNPKDMLDAIIYLQTHRDEIKMGKLS